ncbi:helix-turn-helix domain-containing protein [Tundrisphaera sp. TA3]|uniref:DnaA/Hda family protein n=1 Tax=Tundrisphaera sp. TA3 TaxID=3435775 RepID=UPI003EB7BDE6
MVAGPGPWDGYLVGPENALAQAGVLALARGETDGVSPLVIHGVAGSGKSRLLAGLVAESLIRRPGTALAHLEAEAFAAACAEASARPGGWSDLRDRFRRLGLFVLDDVHALERAPWAMAELAHTLDALDAGGAAVAIGAREAPIHWPPGWPPRLVNRLVGGLAVRVEPPGLETRRRYLLDRARALGMNLPAESVEPMAEAADGFRTLDGWLAQAGLAARVGRRPPDLEVVGPILGADPVGEPPGLDEIARAVAAAFGVRAGDLRADTRRAAVVEARHLAMHLAREHTPMSFRAIGAFFGGRDAATVRHACKAAADRLAADPALAAASAALARSWARGGGGGPEGGAPR